MPDLTNNERLRQIANALEEMNAEVVYVGGAVIQLYSTDGAARNPMTTTDVDCALDISSYGDFMAFQDRLYAKHFLNDTEEGAPICRYIFNGEKVDFMPKEDTGIGESNRWYPMGIRCRQSRRLDTGEVIYVMPVAYYLASKLDALHSRGGDDYRGEKDFEDIVFVLNTCEQVATEVLDSNDPALRAYMKEEFTRMLLRPNLREEIECALLEDNRVDYIIERMRRISVQE